MKTLVTLALVAFLVGCETTPYWAVGAGIKTSESEVIGPNVCGSDVSGLAEIGVKIKEWNLIAGFAHNSQPACGTPFNDEWEPVKNEFFLKYEEELEWPDWITK